MKRPDSPPLKIVVDDGAHIAEHMAQTVFFWFPRIEPRGLLIVEGIQPISSADAFRTQFLPQMMHDLHFCGDPSEETDEPCFPTLFSLLASIHCEMHICIFERNDRKAEDLSLRKATVPNNALDLAQCATRSLDAQPTQANTGMLPSWRIVTECSTYHVDCAIQLQGRLLDYPTTTAGWTCSPAATRSATAAAAHI